MRTWNSDPAYQWSNFAAVLSCALRWLHIPCGCFVLSLCQTLCSLSKRVSGSLNGVQAPEGALPSSGVVVEQGEGCLYVKVCMRAHCSILWIRLQPQDFCNRLHVCCAVVLGEAGTACSGLWLCAMSRGCICTAKMRMHRAGAGWLGSHC